MAHLGRNGHGRENSVEAILDVNRYKPDIIELDVRKSADGVVFGFHGSLPFGFLFAYFLRFFKFRTFKKYFQLDTLSELLAAVKGNPIIYLDIKQRNISPQDFQNVLKNFPQYEIWFAPYSLSYLQELKSFFGKRYKYAYNFGFFQFDKCLEQAKKIGIDSFQIFFWQLNPEILRKIKESGLDYALSLFLLSKKRYFELLQKCHSLWICCDDLKHLD